MVKRRPNYRLVKIHRSYTVEEVADLFSIHKNTVRAWVKADLPTCDGKRPTLILGSELYAFLRSRRTKNKRPCKLGEFYCLRCRVPRFPAESMADFTPITDQVGHLEAICPDCLSIMNRRVSLAKMWQFRAVLLITNRKAPEHVIDTPEPNLNNDLEQGGQDHGKTLSGK